MAASTAAEPGPPRDAVEPGELWPVLAICASLTIAISLIAISAFELALPATTLPAPFPDQHQRAENASFLFTLLVALPAGIVAGRALCGRIARGPGPVALATAALAAAGSLCACIVALRLAGEAAGDHVLVFQLFLIGGWLAATAAALNVLAGRPAGAPPAAGRPPAWTLAAAAIAAVAALLTVVDLGALALLPLGVALLLVLALDRSGWRPPIASPGVGRVLDVLAVVLIVLAVPNLRIFDPSDPFQTTILQFHQDFFLGPAERVLAGDPVLAGPVSQYGVGSIDAVAGWFALAPVNNYSLGLFEGLLSAAMFAAAYGALRLAGVHRLLAALTIVLGLVSCVFALQYPLGGLLQHGAIRFGLPIGVVLGAVAACRRERLGVAVQMLALAVSAIWALEAFAYTLFTFACVLAVETALQPGGERRRFLLRRAALGAAAIVAAQLLFALAMVVATGDLPDWSEYLSTLRAFLTGKLGELTYDFEPFSPAFAVAGVYLVSAVAIVLLLSRGAGRVAAERVKLVALAGATGWGIALFSYFVNRSAGHILPYICLPALMVGALWLALIAERHPDPRSGVRRSSNLAAGGLAALVFATAFPAAGSGFSDSALALAAPGGGSLPNALERTWDPPQLSAGAEEGERLIRREMPGQDQTLMLTSADLGVEILARTGRTNVLPFGDPWEDSFVADLHAQRIRDSVAALEAGDRALIDEPSLKAFRGYRRDPGRDPLADPFGEAAIVPTGVAKLQELALKLIGERFDLAAVARGSDGLEVVELRQRARPAPR